MTVTTLLQFADTVRSRRKHLGMSQAALAERACVSRGWVNEFEAGKARAELALVLRLLDALDLELTVSPRRPDRTRSVHAIDLDDLLERYARP